MYFILTSLERLSGGARQRFQRYHDFWSPEKEPEARFLVAGKGTATGRLFLLSHVGTFFSLAQWLRKFPNLISSMVEEIS